MDMRLRNIMLVGARTPSPSEMVGKSSGRPPAATTPRLTASISSGKWRGGGFKAPAHRAVATAGRARTPPEEAPGGADESPKEREKEGSAYAGQSRARPP